MRCGRRRAILARMQPSVFALLAGLALERLALRPEARALVLGDGPGSVHGTVDALVVIGNKALAATEAARMLVPGGWLAVAILDPANRFYAALAIALGRCSVEPARAPVLEEYEAFTDVERSRRQLEIRVEPTQKWLLLNAPSSAAKVLIASRPEARAALARRVAAELKDLWRDDSFHVPVVVDFAYARRAAI